MAYRDSVISNISLATTAAESPSFTNILFVASHAYYENRITAFSSFDEVRELIPSGSNAYNALRLAFSQPNGAPQPIFLGRRQVDDVTLTPSADRIGRITQYNVTVTSTEGAVTATYTSTTADDAEAIVNALDAAITQTDITATVSGTGADAKLVIAPTTTVIFTVTGVSNLDSSFTSTESAADLLNALLDENDDDWYALATEDHTEAFVLDMAAEIEATGGGNKPKVYAVSTQDAETITPLVSPADDLLGKLQELGYLRTFPIWSHNADTVFPEVGYLAYNAIYDAGVTTYKFMQLRGIGVSEDPVTGKPLSSAKRGYIDDRNGNYLSFERGVLFSREGKVSGGEWFDVVIARDWMNDQIEARLTTLLINQAGGKIPFTNAGKQQVINVVDSVLKLGVDLKILSGYDGTTIPENTPFADQAARILKQVKFTGFLAGAVHFIDISGTLTYEDETLN